MSKKKPAYVDGKFVGDTISISLKPHYQKEYEFLKSHHNRSGLICELVRQYLEGGEMSFGYQKPTQHTEESKVEEEDKPKDNLKNEDKKEDEKEDKREVIDNSKKVPRMSMPSFLSQ